MTDNELDVLHEAYIRSKTVNGRFCPTPEPEAVDESDDEQTYAKADRARSGVCTHERAARRLLR